MPVEAAGEQRRNAAQVVETRQCVCSEVIVRVVFASLGVRANESASDPYDARRFVLALISPWIGHTELMMSMIGRYLMFL